jgi:hypothetical protein
MNLVLVRGESNRDGATVIAANESDLALRQAVAQTWFGIAVAIV